MTHRHLFVCTNARASGKPACGPRGGEAVRAEVQRRLLERGATGVLVTPCGCLGVCFDGPNAVVYPEGVWFAGLIPEDAASLVDHLLGGALEGTALAAKISAPPGSDDDDDGDDPDP